MDAPTTPPPRRFDGLLIALFLAAIAVPGVVGLFEPDAVAEGIAKERRRPAPLPSWPDGAEDVATFAARFDAWFDDHFGLRTPLIRLHNAIKMLLFGVSPLPRMIVGEDGWQFIGYRDYVDGYRGVDPFPPESLEAWVRAIRFKHAWLARQGVHYLFVVAPSKSTIYPDKMPDELDVVSTRRRFDELIERLRADTDVPTIDLRPALRAARDRVDVPLYYPHGSHWNDLGAYYAAREVLRALRRWFPGLEISPLSHYDVRVRHGRGDDTWATRLYLEDHFAQTWVRLVRTRPPFFEAIELGRDEGQVLTFDTGRPNLPRAVLLRDSFGTNVAPLLAPHFSHLTCLWQWYMDPATIPPAIQEADPDVVVDLVVERLLGTVEAPPFAFDDP